MKGLSLTRWVSKKEPSMVKYQRPGQKWLCLFLTGPRIEFLQDQNPFDPHEDSFLYSLFSKISPYNVIFQIIINKELRIENSIFTV
jgi:hypothetical protein